MKAHFHKVPVKSQDSFSIRHDVKPNFGTIWHYHPEIELHYVIRGEGVRFIGDDISNFASGEIILLGENLPHAWRCKEEYFQNNPEYEIEAIVIHFRPDCLGKDLLSLPEAHLLPKLYERARKGMIIHGSARGKLSKLMSKAVQSTNLERIIMMLSIFNILSETDEYTFISTANTYNYCADEIQRLNKIYNYTLSNYKRDISLEEVASFSNLSTTSFCRYFKLMTKKTYYNFLIEVRISNVCRFLIEDRLPTDLICFECGFNNVSNFYRHFKKVTGITPLEYRRKYLSP
jgi:AraC-like DNA-binding protein